MLRKTDKSNSYLQVEQIGLNVQKTVKGMQIMSDGEKRDGKHTPDKQTEHTYPTSSMVRWQKQAAFDPTGVLCGRTSLSRVCWSGSRTH